MIVQIFGGNAGLVDIVGLSILIHRRLTAPRIRQPKVRWPRSASGKHDESDTDDYEFFESSASSRLALQTGPFNRSGSMMLRRWSPVPMAKEESRSYTCRMP
jgi:hypothetical protein